MRSALPAVALLMAVPFLAACSGRGAGPTAPAPDDAPAAPSARGPGARGGGGGSEGPKPYGQVVTDEAVTDRGLLITHRIGDDLLFEIPASVLGRELLFMARPVEASDQSGFFGGGPELIVQWERHGDRVVLREKSYEVVADSTDAIWRQVSGMRKGPVLASLDVKAYGADSAAVVDVTELFTTTQQELGSVPQVQRDRTWIEGVWAFPTNVDVQATQTGQVRPRNGGPGGGPGGGSNEPRTVTRRIHWSMVELPADPMMPRLHDRRIGFISSRYTDYSRREHRAEERRFIHRFRLEPSDTAAFRRGELVDPVEPIVYWIDPATPDWLKPWVVTGVNKWQEAFEEAGFSNAIRGEVAPVDEEWGSLYDARHSVIYWRPSPVPNATGGQNVDPRTGEILKGEVNMYHNVMNLLRNWYFTQVGPLDPRARSLPLPDSLMGRLVEYVVTHEIGHSIGFPHNMKASAMYPADSLRSEAFLRRMGGHVATLMDYSRFNYVAQPEDGIPPELLIPNVGPYDKYAVMWGYRPILDADSPDEERPTLNEWARMQDTIPWFRFSTTDATNDPENLTEAVGDEDAVESSTLGLRNLERVMDMLIPVAEREGEDYSLLDELYGNVVSQWSRYMGHVAALVGGATTQERYGTGPRFEPVSQARQREAVRFLNERAFATPTMLIDRGILRRIEPEGVVPRIRDAQARVIRTLLSPERLQRLVEYEATAASGEDVYTPAELMDDLRSGVWGELQAGRVAIDVYRRNTQRAYLEVIRDQLTEDEESDQRPPWMPEPPPLWGTDVRPVLRAELRAIDRAAQRALARAANPMTRVHLQDVRMEIENILEP
jgi:hypothetical protein